MGPFRLMALRERPVRGLLWPHAIVRERFASRGQAGTGPSISNGTRRSGHGGCPPDRTAHRGRRPDRPSMGVGQSAVASSRARSRTRSAFPATGHGAGLLTTLGRGCRLPPRGAGAYQRTLTASTQGVRHSRNTTSGFRGKGLRCDHSVPSAPVLVDPGRSAAPVGCRSCAVRQRTLAAGPRCRQDDLGTRCVGIEFASGSFGILRPPTARAGTAEPRARASGRARSRGLSARRCGACAHGLRAGVFGRRFSRWRGP